MRDNFGCQQGDEDLGVIKAYCNRCLIGLVRGEKGRQAGLSELRQHRDQEDELILRTGSGLMDLKIINKTANEISIEFIGEGHTILNLLRTELLLDERVMLATYDTNFGHGQSSVPPQDLRS